MTDDLDHPIRRDALALHLAALGVREGTYHLFGAHLENAIVMDHRPDGWVVFYSERGRESSLKAHASEAGTCADLLARLTSGVGFLAYVVFRLVKPRNVSPTRRP